VFSLAGLLLSAGPASCGNERDPLLPEGSGALLTDPVFTPTNLATTFHMTPILFYGGDILRPGDFDFDLAFGSFGTDFKKFDHIIQLNEDSGGSLYTDLGWRFGLSDQIGFLNIPTEIYTQLPMFYGSGSLDSLILQNGRLNPVGSVDEDFAFGKWIWGLRMGLVPETVWSPKVVLGGSVGLPVDDSLASDSTDFDLRLTFEKHLGRGVTGTFFGGVLFPGDGKSVFTDLGIETDSHVPYAGVLAEANLAQLCGRADPGRLWLHVGGSWRDSVYDFGAVGPDYAEEELKFTAGVTADLGWWGPRLGRPQAMIGLVRTLHGGPETGETEFVTQLHVPYKFNRHK